PRRARLRHGLRRERARVPRACGGARCARVRRAGNARRAGGGILPLVARPAPRDARGDRGAARGSRVKRWARYAGWLAVAAAGAFLALQLSYLARIWWWNDHDPGATAFMRAR